ncbi:hypothetical protein BIW11_07377 [Tropilaelaps mercedesae]|uniref:FHA domain-containing protein n=1 Tax=Tropilaelaps mercedesae TaxID=418985 RepID=A0A1V9XU60_9ACAR|nr:hypothetical protein BIW11_07377 [Tropilaelaps mercedesae]
MNGGEKNSAIFGPDGYRHIVRGVCVSGKDIAASYTETVAHFTSIARAIRPYVRCGKIFLHCSSSDADLFMANRPHTVFGSEHVLHLRRILPRIYDLTQMLEIELHDPPPLPKADVIDRLTVALGEFGTVREVVPVSSGHNKYTVTFDDYDSVDVFFLLYMCQRNAGTPLPVTGLPIKNNSPSWNPLRCTPSTTALSHLLRVGPPNLTAAGLMAISFKRDVKYERPSTIRGNSTARHNPPALTSPLLQKNRCSQATEALTEPSTCPVLSATSTKSNEDLLSCWNPRSQKRLRTKRLSREKMDAKEGATSPEVKKLKMKSQSPLSTLHAPFQDFQPGSQNVQLRGLWELHKYVGGERCGESINLSMLEFPVTIGRDPAKAKIHVEGPSMQHVSRLHAEILKKEKQGESADALWLDCHSTNGAVVDGVHIKKGCRAEIRDKSTFILGDVSYLEGSDAPNRELRFTLHRVIDREKGDKNYNGPICWKSSVSILGSDGNAENRENHAITISDSEEEQDIKYVIPLNPNARISAVRRNASDERYHEVIVLSDDDDDTPESVRFQQMVMKFKDEPIDSDEALAKSPSVPIPFQLPVAEQGSNTASGQSRPAPIGIPNVHLSKAPVAGISSTARAPMIVPFSHRVPGIPTCDFFKLNVKTSEREPIRRVSTSNDTTARYTERETAGPSRRLSSPTATPRPLPNIRIGFDEFRRCLLDFRLNLSGLPQPSQTRFINYVKHSGIPSNTGELTRLLFSCFCLEASARLEIALCHRERKIIPQEQSQPIGESCLSSSLVSQKQLANGVLRVRLIATCNNGAGRPLKSASMVLLHVKCVRRGGKQLRLRSLLGLVYSSERKDRRDRSGAVALPDVLFKYETLLDVVDDVLIDMNAHELEGLQLQTDQLLRLERLCEVNELKKVVSMRQLPSSRSLFLLGQPSSRFRATIWGPEEASLAQTSPSICLQRAMRCIALTPKLSSEQSVVVCAALAQAVSEPRKSEGKGEVPMITTMLVEGGAGSGKTTVLQEVALQVVLAKPLDTVLIFCKWPHAADQMALKLKGLIASRGHGDRVQVTRIGRSRNPAVVPLTLNERFKQERAKESEGARNRLKASVAEMEKFIEGLRHSLEDQLSELSPALKRKKLQEIGQFEEVLSADQQRLAHMEKRVDQSEHASNMSAARRRRILEGSHILVCGYIDVETSIVGHAFERDHGKRFSLILVDQAQEVSVADLVPLMQLPVNRLVFFGDRAQSSYCRPKHQVVRDNALLKQSVFGRMISACPDKAFYLRNQWRLPNPLDVIVNDTFYQGKLRLMHGASSSTKASRNMNCVTKLAALTMINVTNAELLPNRDLPRIPMSMIRNVVEALAPHCSRIHVVLSFSSTRLPVSLLPLHLTSSCEAHIIGPDLIPHISDPDVVVLPLFNLPFVEELEHRDRQLLCSIVTRPSISLVIVGHLAAAARTAEQIEELVQRAKRANRYINEKPSWLAKITSENLSQYLMQ